MRVPIAPLDLSLLGRARREGLLLLDWLSLTLPRWRIGRTEGAVLAAVAAFLLALPPMFTQSYTAIRGVDPQDWDVATDATPEQIQKLFAKSLYTNRFGTVVVRSGDHEVEVRFRGAVGWSDSQNWPSCSSPSPVSTKILRGFPASRLASTSIMGRSRIHHWWTGRRCSQSASSSASRSGATRILPSDSPITTPAGLALPI